MLSAAIDARKHSLKALRGRIEELLDPIPVGVNLSDEGGLVCAIIRVYTGASQRGNRTWDVTIKDVTIKGWAAITPDGKLLCEHLDASYSDPTVPYPRPEYAEDQRLSWASGKNTRAAAIRLARAIERYMDECRAEAMQNSATLAIATGPNEGGA